MANRQKQRAVREGQLERTLQNFKEELARDFAKLLAEFAMQYVQPLEARIKHFEEWAQAVSAGGDDEPLPEYEVLPATEEPTA